VIKLPEENLYLPNITKLAKDITKVDLSSFKARVVRNDQPFIIPNLIKKNESFEAITYYYGSQYADLHLHKKQGLFIEFHDFCQTITPLHESAGGFCILARPIDPQLAK
jgi:hypothetical protein